MDDPKRIRRLVCLIPVVVVLAVIFFVLRGPHISNALKKIILPELEMATGRKVIAQKIYINLFPLFIEAKGIKIFDETGERILVVQRAKGYLGLSGILDKSLTIRRLVIKGPAVTAERAQVEEIAENVKSYLEKTRETALKVKVRVVEVQGGDLNFDDTANKASTGIWGFKSEIILGETQRITASARRVDFRKEGWPDISGDVELGLLVKDGGVELKNLTVGLLGSRLTGSGEYVKDKGSFRTGIELLVMSVKKVFSLERSGEGRISAQGNISYADKKIITDLKLDGSFYIQTLMELLEVEERVEGLIDVRGVVKGPLNDIKGAGTALLRKGNLFDVDVDSLKCTVSYADGTMRFTDGTGRLYNGSARMSASITLPKVDYFTLGIDFLGVDSKPLFKLIGWDPGIQPGKVNGTLSNAGADFNPEGWFTYKSAAQGKDVLGRAKDISGRYKLEGSLLTLSGLKLGTGRTDLALEGTADIDKKELNFGGSLKTSDINDLTAPYRELKGSGEFAGKLVGTFDDPVISGNIKIKDPVFERYSGTQAEADVTYRKDLLSIREMNFRGKGELYRLNGKIYFKEAKELFDLAWPEYLLNASVESADLGRFVKAFYPDFTGTGKVRSEIKITGKAESPEIRGSASVENASVYNIPFDSASFDWSYAQERFSFQKVKAGRGKSEIAGDAAIDGKGNFSYKASSDRLLLSDLVGREINGEAVFRVKSEGRGTFGDPSISLEARMLEGRLRGKPVGNGSVTASIKEKDISLKGSLFDDKVTVTGKGRFEKEVPWNAKVEVRTGRYDSIISAFLKDVPEDLLLSLSGSAILTGNREHVHGSAEIKRLALTMYGYSFTNEKDIRFDFRDREIVMERVSLRSGSTSLHMSGGLVLGSRYNLTFEGTSELSPFKSVSTRIGTLRGDAELVLTVTGSWDNPQINGGVNLKNGAFGLKEYSYRISSLSGYLYMDNDRIVLQQLSGKVGGGDIDLSGVIYLKKFSFKRFYVEAALNNISASVSGDFNFNFGGNMLYKGTPEAQTISGDLRINRARYRERVEWKSWLLKTKKAEKFKAEIAGIDKAELNVRITGKENITIDNNVARASAAADFVLRGTVYRPRLFGRLETREGTVYFRNNEFRILHASADFSDPNRLNPVIEIAAETEVRGYKIKMNLEGRLDHFNMSLSSDPVLKEIDILSLLTVGQTGGELKGLEGGIGAGEATSFVTGKLQDVIEERMRNITGLDRFQIDPYVSKTTGTIEPRVVVSKRLLGDKVFVTYTSTVGSTEEQIIKIEYFLSKNSSLIGVRDERGFVGGDVRFRFEFK